MSTQLIPPASGALRLVGKLPPDILLEELFNLLIQAPTVTAQLSILNARSEDEVLQLRQKAGGQESLAWRTKMSCDVNLVNRGHARRGRGNVDIFGYGVKAAVKERAKELACSTSTIWLNLRIFKTFFQNDISEYTILEDKGFYLAALRANNPLIAFRVFVRQRRKHGANFRVNDAFRWTNKKREQLRQRETYGRVRRSELIPFLERDIDKLTEMKRAFPDQRLAARVYDPMIEALSDELTDILEVTTRKLLRGICEASPTLIFSEDDLIRQTGLSVGNVRHYMRQLEDERVVYRVNCRIPSWQVPQLAPERTVELRRFG